MTKLTSADIPAANASRERMKLPLLNPHAYPMPPVQQDPSVVAGNAAKASYLTQVQAIRSESDLTDLAKARRVVALWDSTCAELSRLYVDLQDRRQGRLAELEPQVPYGPDIPDGSSPADQVVLHAAFRDAVERARNADERGLAQMYSDAEVFGDTFTQRAVFTVAHEQGRGYMVKAYAAHHPDTVALLDEIDELRRSIAGSGEGRAWVTKALAIGPMGLMTQPDEVNQLPQLENLEANRLQTLRGRGF